MNTTKSVVRLEREIDALRQALLALGPIHPGSVSRQYQVCGNPGCRCMDPTHPQRHGPYPKLAYVHRGKPVCRFVRADCIAKLNKRLAAYKTFRNLVDCWIALSIQQGQAEFFRRVDPRNAKPSPNPSALRLRKKHNRS